jgi:hypothetical protein
MESMSADYPEPAVPGGRRRTTLIATCTILVVISCCCILAAGLVAYLDPFDWNLIARLTGRYDAAAEAVPADAAAYVGIDLLRLRSAEADRVFNAFAESIPESRFSSADDFLQDLDEEMEREAGFNLTDDVLPWVGQHAGFGITDLQVDPFGEVDRVEFIFAAAIRDRAAAEAFSLLLQNRIAAQSGATIQTSEHAGTTIFHLPGFQGDGIAFAIHRGIFLLAMDAGGIRASIDAKSGESFMDTPTFRDLSAELPAEALLTVFISAGLIDELTGSAATGAVSATMSYAMAPFETGVFAFSFVPAGIRVDYALSYDPENPSELRRQQLDLQSAGTTIDARLPENTLLFVGGRGLHLTYPLMREQMEASDRAAFEESMAAFEEELGFNLETDLFANLDGEYALAVLPNNDGFLAAQDIDLGLALLFETGNPAGLNPVLSGIENLLTNELGTAPEAIDLDGRIIYQVADLFLGEVLAYGVVDDLFLVTTSASLARDLLEDRPSLQESAVYNELWSDFPDGLNPVVYLDMGGLLGTIREGMTAADREDFNAEIGASLGPIDFVAMGNRLPNPDLQWGTLIVFISSGSE